MTIEKQVADLVVKAKREGYEQGYKAGVNAACDAVSSVARATTSEAKAPKPRKPRKARLTKAPSKIAVARDVISGLVAGGSAVAIDAIETAAKEKDGRIGRPDISNALRSMTETGAVTMVEPGVYQAAQEQASV